MTKRRVVVTGVGAISPVGNDVATTWRSLIDGRSGAAPITKFDAAKFPVRFACEVKGFDPLAYLDRKEAKRMDLFAQLAMAAAHQAVTQAGLEGKFPVPERTGVVGGHDPADGRSRVGRFDGRVVAGPAPGRQRRVERQHLPGLGEGVLGHGQRHSRLQHSREVPGVVLEDSIESLGADLEVGFRHRPAPAQLRTTTPETHGLAVGRRRPQQLRGLLVTGRRLCFHRLCFHRRSMTPAASSGCCR